MADKKISALTAATTPLAGSEVLPIVQSGATVKVSIADVTAGRGISATSVTNGLGAVGTPSYTFTGDTNTGMWSPAADTVAVSTAGSERFRVSDAGNIGVGATVPGATGIAPFVAIGANNAGIGSASTNNIAIVTANTERMRITGSGDVGIGTTAPQRALQIAAGEPTVVLESTSALVDETRWRVRVNTGGDFSIGAINDAFNAGQDAYQITRGTGAVVDSHRFITANTERMRINSSGSVGIGTTAPDGLLTIASAIPLFYWNETDQAVDERKWRFGVQGKVLSLQTTNDALSAAANAYQIVRGTGTAVDTQIFSTGGSERMRIDSSGNVLVATTSASSSSVADGFVVAGSNGALVSRRTSGAAQTHVNFINGGTSVGSISTSTTATSYNVSSDARLKDNIADADNAAALIDALQVRKFDWKSNGFHQRYGFVAQELVEVTPEAVYQPEDAEEMMGVDYSKLVPMLVKEIQSLRARVAQLEAN